MDIKELIGTNEHYSCSNQINKNKILEVKARKARNFYFMTIKELVKYWEEMNKKYEKAEAYKYKRKNKEIDETQLDIEFEKDEEFED